MTTGQGGRAWRVIVLSIAALLSSGRARAQDTLAYELGGDRWTLCEQDVDALREVVGLSPEQTQAARELLRGAQAEWEREDRRSDRELSPLRMRLGWGEAPDPSVNDRCVAAVERHLANAEAIERRFLADARALLDPTQSGAWETYERARRRRLLAFAECEDLTRLLRSFALAAEVRAAIAPALESYEQELDVAIKEWRGLSRATRPHARDYGPGEETEEQQRAQTRLDEAGRRLVQISSRHAQALARHLEPGQARLLTTRAFRDRGWVQSFEEDWMLRDLLALRGQTDAQREEVRKVLREGDLELRRRNPEYYELREKIARGDAPEDGALAGAMMKTAREASTLRQEILDRALATLTPEQRAAYLDGSDPADEGREERERGVAWWR